MNKPRVLFVCHNHPGTRPGGAEAYALELYHAIKAAGEYDPVILCKGGPPNAPVPRPHPGTQFCTVNGDPGQYFVLTDGYCYDWIYGTITDKELYTKHFHQFLLAMRPDIVHFQHTMFIGYDVIRQVRNTLPRARIVYTLHEFMPICHRQGQMLRTLDDQPCMLASPTRCNECFPGITPQTFFMRKRFVQSHFELVDLFLAPSCFLRDRYIDWGIPAEKIRFEEYGRSIPPRQALRQAAVRNRLGFFGQINPYKGVHVLLKAMKLLADEALADPDNCGTMPHLWIHGANLDIQEGTFRNSFRELLAACGQSVIMLGRYDHEMLPRLMDNIDWVVVPSIWWENSPLVIQEAFAHGRPVICSDIGGMGEKVRHDVDGLHFRAGDPISLAETIRQAVGSADCWNRLASGIRPVYSMDQHLQTICGVYRELLCDFAAERRSYANAD